MIRGKAAYLNRLYARTPIRIMTAKEHVEGSSPPSVFVGKSGYPKVYVGPMVPDMHGDTAAMDQPELWTQRQQKEIIDFRLQLIRGKHAVKVTEKNRFVEEMQSIALAKQSVDIDIDFRKKPTGVYFHEEVQPFGPSAQVKKVKVGSSRMDHDMEKAYYDTDLLAGRAAIDLYHKGVLFSSIQKAFSTGAFGLGKNRKLVPTRWSITAVDDILGKHLLQKVKTYTKLEEFRVYKIENLKNKFVILLLPSSWQYETMEAFFPGTIGTKTEIYGDHEYFEGKKEYAMIGGCYYSARLAVTEQMEKERMQAGAVIMREVYPGYVPLGVWNVRENMRTAMKTEPRRFETFADALSYCQSQLTIPMGRWAKQSVLLKDWGRSTHGMRQALRQQRLTAFAQ